MSPFGGIFLPGRPCAVPSEGKSNDQATPVAMAGPRFSRISVRNCPSISVRHQFKGRFTSMAWRGYPILKLSVRPMGLWGGKPAGLERRCDQPFWATIADLTANLDGFTPSPRPNHLPKSPQAPEGPLVIGCPRRPIAPERHLDAVLARLKVDLVRYLRRVMSVLATCLLCWLG